MPLVNVLSVAALAALAWMAVRLLDLQWWWVPVFGVGFLFLSPTRTAAWLGSQGPIIAALIAATWVSRDRPIGGIWLGVAATLKLFPGLLIPMLWFQGRKRAAVGALSVVAGLNLAGLLLPDVTLAGSVETITALDMSANPGNLSLGLPVAVAAVLAVGLIWWSRRLTFNQTMVVGSLGMLALSPVVWLHYLPVVYLPVVVMGRRLAESVKGEPRSGDQVTVLGEHVDGVDLSGVAPQSRHLSDSYRTGRGVG